MIPVDPRNIVPTAEAEIRKMEEALQKLHNAVRLERSRKWCLTLWSRFIRLRDGKRCVVCGSKDGLAAHHIFRKVVLPQAQFLTGNGISLCSEHHDITHEIWNGTPLPAEPLNCRGGDDPNLTHDLYELLEEDAVRRGIFRDDFYYLSDHILDGFLAWQGFGPIELCLPPLSAARLIWKQMSVDFYEVVGETVGESMLGAPGHILERLDEKLNTIN